MVTYAYCFFNPPECYLQTQSFLSALFPTGSQTKYCFATLISCSGHTFRLICPTNSITSLCTSLHQRYVLRLTTKNSPHSLFPNIIPYVRDKPHYFHTLKPLQFYSATLGTRHTPQRGQLKSNRILDGKPNDVVIVQRLLFVL
jgi:hypothetical protein